MRNRYSNEELLTMDAIDVYELLLDGVINRFPPGFWQQPEAKQNAGRCTRYLLEDILKYNEEMIKEKNSADLYAKYKLNGMLQNCFNGSPYAAINETYPGKFKKSDFK